MSEQADLEKMAMEYQDARNLWNVDDTSSHQHFIEVMQGAINQLAEARRDKERLEKAVSGMLENYIQLKQITLAMARSDSPNWIGSRLTPDDDIHVVAVRAAMSAHETKEAR